MEKNDKRSELKALLADAGDEEPIFLSPTDLDWLTAADVPEGTRIEVAVVEKGRP